MEIHGIQFGEEVTVFDRRGHWIISLRRICLVTGSSIAEHCSVNHGFETSESGSSIRIVSIFG